LQQPCIDREIGHGGVLRGLARMRSENETSQRGAPDM
jgi:hypothetical protein